MSKDKKDYRASFFEESWVPVYAGERCPACAKEIFSYSDACGSDSCYVKKHKESVNNPKYTVVDEAAFIPYEDDRGDPDFLAALVDIETLHKNKSSTYGTSEDSFANFTDVGRVTGKPPEYYALLRIVEKCSRAVHQIDAGNHDDVKEYPDIAGLALCCEALKQKRLH